MNKKRTGAHVAEPAAIYECTDRSARQPLAPSETIAKVRQGLPMVEFECLAELLGLGAEVLGAHLSISRSTLMRRRKAGHLDMLESDRLLRFARLYGRASEVLGDGEAARTWLREPARALGFVTPLTFAETETGAREVENLLGRIEDGVFS